MRKRLMITGVSGFLGSRIACFARQAGWEVSGYDRRAVPAGMGVTSFVGDLSDTDRLREACVGMSALVHAAGLAHVLGRDAKDRARFREVNEIGTRNVAEAARECGIPHLVLVSSVSVYGNYVGNKCDEAMPCHPQGPYAESKLGAELMAREYMSDGRGSLTVLRFATLYGEADPGNVARLIRAIEQGRFIWPGSGATLKSLIHRDDAARACVRAVERPMEGSGVFNVSGPAATMREIVEAICGALGRPAPRYSIPLLMLRAAGAAMRGLGDPGNLAASLHKFTRNDVYDGAKFQAAFAFEPQMSLREGMKREIAYLKARPAEGQA